MRYKFDKSASLCTKGVLILLIVIHHVLSDQTHTVNALFPLPVMFPGFCKCALGGFVFISGYGLTKKYMQDEDAKAISMASISQLIKLFMNFWCVYVIALLVKVFMERQTALYVYYNSSCKFDPFFMLFDILGLSVLMGTSTLNMTWWYMSLSVMIIITMPLLFRGMKSIGFIMLPILLFVPRMVLVDGANYVSLLPCLGLGMFAAQYHWMDRILTWASGKKVVIGWLLGGVGMVAGWMLTKSISLAIAYPVCGIALPLLCSSTITRIPGLNRVFEFIGKHSMNIFLIHTFVFYYYLGDLVYSLAYDWLVVLATLVISILLSVVLEIIKKLVHYDALVNAVLRLCHTIFEKEMP